MELNFFRSLKNRDFRLYWFTQVVSINGTFIQMAAQGWLIIQLTNSPFYLGLAVLAGSLPILLFSLFAGVMADRFSKRNILVITQTIAMLLAFTMSYLIFSGKVTIWHILTLATLLGINTAFDIPTRQSFIIELVGKEDVLNAVSLNTTLTNSARIIAPVVAAFIIDKLGMAVCFLVNGITFLPLIIALLFVTNIPPSTKKEEKNMVRELKEGLFYIKDNRLIFYIFLFIALSSIFIFPYTVLMPAFARQVMHLDVKGFGFLVMASGIGAFLASSTLAGLGNYSKKGWLLTIATLVLPLLLIAFACSKVFSLAFVLLLGLGFCWALQLVISNTCIQEKVPDHLRGRLMSVYVITFMGISPLGSFTLGSAASFIGIPLALTLSGILHLLITVFIHYKVKDLRTL